MKRSTKVPGAVGVLMAMLFLGGCGGKQAGPNEVTIEVTDAGFVPAVARVPRGQAVTLVVTRKTDQTCAREMVFVGTGEKHDLPFQQTVRIELPADHADTLNYACAMDMIKGQIVAK